jgi:hypothetical protein
MDGAEDERTDLGKVQPVRKLSSDHAARFPTASAGYDFDAADLFGMSRAQEGHQRVKGTLGRHSMQIEAPSGDQLARAKPLPGRAVDAAGLIADGQR